MIPPLRRYRVAEEKDQLCRSGNLYRVDKNPKERDNSLQIRPAGKSNRSRGSLCATGPSFLFKRPGIWVLFINKGDVTAKRRNWRTCFCWPSLLEDYLSSLSLAFYHSSNLVLRAFLSSRATIYFSNTQKISLRTATCTGQHHQLKK